MSASPGVPTDAQGPMAVAFDGPRLVGRGPLVPLADRLRRRRDTAGILVFDDTTGAVIDLDLRAEGAPPQAAAVSAPAAAAPATRPGPGRPRLGVVGREVTLLPRHWDWLAGQPGGASVTLRRLVDRARVAGAETQRVRQAREAAYRFMTAMAGDRPGFEEATRALFAGRAALFARHTSSWPAGIRRQARTMMARTL